MNNLLSALSKILLVPILFLFAHAGISLAPAVAHAPANVVATYGAVYNPTGGGTYRLQASVGATDTSITLVSFDEPVSGIPYTMAYLNSSIEYATLEPQTTAKEFISFTGITQNTDGSATLTGVTRGLSFSYPYTATTTDQQPHPAQSILILSNPPQLYQNYANINNPETITGDWDVPYPADPSSVVPRSYVDGAAFGGIGGATETATGTVQIATGIQIASSTVNGSVGRLAIPSSLATSTGGTASAAQHAIVSNNSGYLDPSWLSTTASTYQLGIAASSTVGANNIYQVGMNATYINSVGTTTYTVPANVTKLFIRAVQSGGGTGNGTITGGGGAGGYAEGYFTVSPGQVIGVGIGPAGIGNASVGNGMIASSTLVYNTTTSTALITCTGGTAPVGENESGTAYAIAAGGTGGTCTGGTLNSTGMSGTPGFYINNNTNISSGMGGQTPFGIYGAGGSISVNNGNGNLGLVVLSY